jgi:sporulation protein YlmC with PRC-barrel domain
MIVLVVAIVAAVLGYSGIAARDKSGMLKAGDVGMQVVGIHGKYLGTINDLVINPDGDVVYALIDISAFSRTGEKYVAVPGNALRSTDNGTKIVLETTFDEFSESARLAEDLMQPS